MKTCHRPYESREVMKNPRELLQYKAFVTIHKGLRRSGLSLLDAFVQAVVTTNDERMEQAIRRDPDLIGHWLSARALSPRCVGFRPNAEIVQDEPPVYVMPGGQEVLEC